ncbi:FAD-dependent oxidoreductase [Oscillospiraceae bacterium WX1]
MKVVVIGGGFAGHTAALYTKMWLGDRHDVTVVSDRSYFQYTPSLVWVGVGTMAAEKTYFPLAPIYKRRGIHFVNQRAVAVNVEGKKITVQDGTQLDYDYVVFATGPHLNFSGTPGLGPNAGQTVSICTADHATHARDAYFSCVAKMERGEKQTFVIGTGHASATCQGAAFEYIHNIHNDLTRRHLRDKCELIWFTNEPYAGDFGMGGIIGNFAGAKRNSGELVKWLMRDCGITIVDSAAPMKIDSNTLHWENTRQEEGAIRFDFSMLIPQFLGSKISYVNNAGEDMSDKVCNPAGFIKVDADYTSGAKPMADWSASDWPTTYQSPFSPSIFAAGIAFAPPHPISPPSGTTKSGVKIHAAPPRTGMTSGIIGKVVAENVTALVKGEKKPPVQLSMSQIPAACIASLNKSIVTGSAMTMVLTPAVPDYSTYPKEDGGRNLKQTFFDLGKGGAWLKRALHTGFMYKFKGNPGWTVIPE